MSAYGRPFRFARKVPFAICDDTVEDIAQLSDALFSYDPLFEITSFTSGKMLTDEFLDISMTGLDSIQTAQKIRAIQKGLKIIILL